MIHSPLSEDLGNSLFGRDWHSSRHGCQRQVLVSHAIWPVPYRSFNTRPEPSNEDPRHLHAPVGYRFRSVTIFRSFYDVLSFGPRL